MQTRKVFREPQLALLEQSIIEVFCELVDPFDKRTSGRSWVSAKVSPCDARLSGSHDHFGDNKTGFANSAETRRIEPRWHVRDVEFIR